MGSTVTLAKATAVEPTFLPEGWEIKVVGSAAELDAPAVGAQLISADDATGEVTAIVGVTGIVDHVDDLIEPGAYKNTLAKRRPKVCWAHDWEKPVGRVPAIEEWPPGDPRFAQVKATLDGKPWPAAAGALVASMQFNMGSERGREAFAAVKFYSETGECEWSIGWRTVPGQTTRRKDGVRVCKSVELFEVSPVLFGAAPLTRTLQVKSIRLADAYADQVEGKAGQSAGGGPDEGELHRLAMDEIDWAEVDAAIDGTGPGTAPAAPAAGPAFKSNTYALRVEAKTMLLADGLLADGLPDFGALASALSEVKAGEGGADRNRGNAEQLRRWYEDGEGAAEIRWGQPGDLQRCVDIAGKHMDPQRAKGYCNLRHHGALGVYAGQEKAAHDATATLAKTWSPLLEVGVDAAHTERKHMGEGGGLRGTYEQRRDHIERELTPLLRELHGWIDPGPETTGPVPEPGWVHIEGTWENRVVATYVDYSGPGPSQRDTYEVDYAWDGEALTLGTPRRVELQVSIVPVLAGSDVPDAWDVQDALMLPAVGRLDDGIAAVKGALARTEVKVGRVMSEANMSRLRGALEHLLEVARAAGVDLPGWTGSDPKPSTAGVTPDTTAVTRPGTPASAATGVKTLSVASVRADLERFSNFLS